MDLSCLRCRDRHAAEVKEKDNEIFLLKKKCTTSEINEAYAETIERQDIERQKQAVIINKLKQKGESLQAQNNVLRSTNILLEKELDKLKNKE